MKDAATTIDLYALLGVARDAPGREIRRAYRRLARQHHPDLNPQSGGSEQFGRLAHAYEILRDPVQRADYDRTLLDAAAGARSTRIPTRGASPPIGRTLRGTLDLSPAEVLQLTRGALMLRDAMGHTILLRAGLGHGDQITVRYGADVAVLTIRTPKKT